MKEYQNSTLTNDDILMEVKRHAGQLHILLGLCRGRGIQTSALGILMEYTGIADLKASFAIVDKFTGESFLWGDGKPVLAVTKEEAEILVKQFNEHLVIPNASMKELK